jgi:hypothetical protein
VIDGGLATLNRLQPVLDVEQFRSGQRIKRERGELGLGGVEAVQGGRGGLATRSTSDTKVTQVNSRDLSDAPRVLMPTD